MIPANSWTVSGNWRLIMNKVYTRDSFMDSYNSLPELFRGNIRDALVEFRDSRLMKSRHPEKLPAYSGMYSLRVDRRYRILMNKIASGTYVLLLAGPHDVTYDWAEKNKKAVGGMSMDPSDYTPLEEAMPELFSMQETLPEKDNQPAVGVEPRRKGLFAKFSDRKLMKGLAGPEELDIVRSWNTLEDFEAQEGTITRSSVFYLRHLCDGMSVEEALHELNMLKQNHEEHEAFERGMDNIRKNYRSTYINSNFPHISGENGKYCLLAGTFGSGKTAELIGSINHADEYVSKRDRILFLVSNPDYLSDMRSYLQIVADPKQMKRVDVLDYTGLMRHLMEDCGKRWGYDFRVAEINEDDDLLDMFLEAAESVEDMDLESWDLMHDWEYVVENYGTFTEEDYMTTPRLECENITEEQREKVWEVFEEFIRRMEEERFYTVGYAISKLMPAIKRKSYKPYSLILADDIQFLNYLKVDFLTLLQKSSLSAYTIDIGQEHYVHCMRDLTNPKCIEGKIFYGIKNLRLDAEKMKLACPQVPASMTKLQTNMKGIELIQVESCAPEDNSEFEKKLCELVRSLPDPNNNVIVAIDDEDAEAYSEILERNGINTVIVDDSQSYFDYLLDNGIRICTYIRLGCLVFENVIIPDTYEDLLDPNDDSGLGIPDRYWYFDWTERLAYKMMLFGHAVAASRKTTYLFEPKDDASLVQLYRENVN